MAKPSPAKTSHDALFPPHEHDHGGCLDGAVTRARAICAKKSIRFTPLREMVFREIASHHTPLGAYDIIDRLAVQGRRLAPISVYRIIEVLEEAGLVHRLESRNAYFACLAEDCAAASSVVLLCETCGRVAEAEAPEAWNAIAAVTRSSNFKVAETVLEIKGRCADCDSQGRAA